MSRYTVFKNCALIDGTGASPVFNGVIVVEGERIKDVGHDIQVDKPKNDVEIHDLHGMTVMPGLIDSHIHLANISLIRGFNESPFPIPSPATISPHMQVLIAAYGARKYLEQGITTLRDLNPTFNDITVGLRDAIDAGAVSGPRLVVSGRSLAITGGHASGLYNAQEVDGPEEIRKAVRERVKQRVDLIKLMVPRDQSLMGGMIFPGFTLEEMKAAVEETHAVGKIVAAHAIGDEMVRNAIEAGVDTIEHGGPFDDETAKLMAKKEVILCPTLTTYQKKYYHLFDECVDRFKKALRAGVKIAMGTDAFCFGARWSPYELELMVKSGMTPMQSIVASTKTAAEACCLGEELGTLERGKLADLIAVDGNPLEDIGVLQQLNLIKLVMKGGEVVISRI